MPDVSSICQKRIGASDCLVLTAQGLRAHGVTQRELDLMYKINPAKLLGLPPPEEAGTTTVARP